ncbi:MAG: hypothetical protein AABW48_02975 [Nanoarchaeota archaeon]
MGELIVFEDRMVKARGLDKSQKPDENKVKTYFFCEDYDHLSKALSLPKVSVGQAVNPTETLTLFYPGCGADILFPLKYVEQLFPNITEINFIFNDLDDNLNLIKTVLDEVGISFAEEDHKINFYWKDMLINLDFQSGNVFEMELPQFDIYFEKAFRIMKGYHPEYENKIFTKLNLGGILISDSGFQEFPLKKLKVSPKLSTYGEMIIGVKKQSIKS